MGLNRQASRQKARHPNCAAVNQDQSAEPAATEAPTPLPSSQLPVCDPALELAVIILPFARPTLLQARNLHSPVKVAARRVVVVLVAEHVVLQALVVQRFGQQVAGVVRGKGAAAFWGEVGGVGVAPVLHILAGHMRVHVVQEPAHPSATTTLKSQTPATSMVTQPSFSRKPARASPPPLIWEVYPNIRRSGTSGGCGSGQGGVCMGKVRMPGAAAR